MKDNKTSKHQFVATVGSFTITQFAGTFFARNGKGLCFTNKRLSALQSKVQQVERGF